MRASGAQSTGSWCALHVAVESLLELGARLEHVGTPQMSRWVLLRFRPIALPDNLVNRSAFALPQGLRTL